MTSKFVTSHLAVDSHGKTDDFTGSSEASESVIPVSGG
jgi:hypothetical protein